MFMSRGRDKGSINAKMCRLDTVATPTLQRQLMENAAEHRSESDDYIRLYTVTYDYIYTIMVTNMITT